MLTAKYKYLYPGQRVRVHVEPAHNGIDYGPGEIVEILPGIIELAIVRLDTGKEIRFNTRWISAEVGE